MGVGVGLDGGRCTVVAVYRWRFAEQPPVTAVAMVTQSPLGATLATRTGSRHVAASWTPNRF